MTFASAAVSLTVLMLLAAVFLGWVSELKRVGTSVSARESRAAAEGRATFYASKHERAEAMRERIRRERRRRERARAAAGARPAADAPPADGPASPPPPPESPEAVHRATLELGSLPVTEDVLRVHYRRLVVAYHPDRVAGLGDKLQQLAEEETKAINEAYAFFKARL